MVDPLEALPYETILLILVLLDPFTLSGLDLVSKRWNALASDEQLWKAVGLQLGYCSRQRSGPVFPVTGTLQDTSTDYDPSAQFDPLEDAVRRIRDRGLATHRFGTHVHTYRQLCCECWRLECHWTGRDDYQYHAESAATGSRGGPAQPNVALKPSQKVFRRRDGERNAFWRFKLDPLGATLLSTGENGGVQCTDHDAGRHWQIPPEGTRPHPHLEFSYGHMVFDRIGLAHFEVWKSVSLMDADDDDDDDADEPDRLVGGRDFGFCRIALLESPHPIRAFRFQFPWLVAATANGYVLVWNVNQIGLGQTIDIRDSPHARGNITYIDFDDEYIFLVGSGAKNVTIYSRASCLQVWNLGRHFERRMAGPSTWRAVCNEVPRSNQTFARMSFRAEPPGAWQSGPNFMNPAQVYMMPYQEWGAVHPDVRTNTLVLLGQGSVLLLRDYKAFLRDPSRAPAAFQEIVFREMLYGLDRHFGGPGRSLDVDEPREVLHASPSMCLAVNEGKAFCVNLEAMFIDLELPGPVIPAHSSVRYPITSAEPSAATDAAAGAPPPICTMYMRPAGFALDRASRRTHRWSLYNCSCVQMDVTGGYCIDVDGPPDPDAQGTVVGERVVRKFEFAQVDAVLVEGERRGRWTGDGDGDGDGEGEGEEGREADDDGLPPL